MKIGAINIRPLKNLFLAAAVTGMVTASAPSKKAQPLPKSYETVNIGNITYYVNDLKEKDAVREIRHEDMTTEYFVSLKNGTVVNYYDKQYINANVIDGIDFGYEGKYEPYGVKFTNCRLKSITGTNGRDYYYLKGSDVDIIDFKKCDDEKSSDELRVHGSKCKNIIAKDKLSVSGTGDVRNLNEGWFEREEWQEE